MNNNDYLYNEQTFEDTNEVIRICKSKHW